MLKLVKSIKLSTLTLTIAVGIAVAICSFLAIFNHTNGCWYGVIAFSVLCIIMKFVCNKFADYEFDLYEEEEEGEEEAL